MHIKLTEGCGVNSALFEVVKKDCINNWLFFLLSNDFYWERKEKQIKPATVSSFIKRSRSLVGG